MSIDDKVIDRPIIGYASMASMAVADTVLTYSNIQRYGLEFEGNPIMYETMNLFGDAGGLIIPKLAMMTAIVCITETSKYKFLPDIAAAVWGIGAIFNLYFGVM